eukprot:jgi/Hompol1/4958/HPOL_001890-RA
MSAMAPIVGQLGPAHTRYVKNLYRRSLRLAQDWYWRREELREISVKIRLLFDAQKSLANPKLIEATLLNTERILAVNAHPIPFVATSGNGGTKWERNTPIPEEVLRRGCLPHDNYT